MQNDELREMLADAYATGATDVHNSWVAGTNGGEPDFNESASDYAASIELADTIAALQAEVARLREENEALREALVVLHHAVCGETGFANAVREESGKAYPWPALDIADEKARKALENRHD